MEDMTTLKDIEKIITKELRKNVDKGTMSPPEIDAVNKAVDALEKIAKIEQICKEIEAMEEMKKNPDMYSGAFYNIRNFPSHGMIPPMSYGWDGWREDMNYSGERGRSARTGRFTSREYSGDRSMRNMNDYSNRSYENMGGNQSRDNYSGHSVNDRMVDQLERMMDTANSEFERQQILDKIKMIRNSPDRLG